MLPDLRSGQGKYLLHGVTGSGKTEVFIRLVRQTLVQGKSAMILVPEIALTPQMVMWFRARFGAVAAVLHSRRSAGERFVSGGASGAATRRSSSAHGRRCSRRAGIWADCRG